MTIRSLKDPSPSSEDPQDPSSGGSQDIASQKPSPLSEEAQANLWRYIEHLERWRQSIGFEIHDGLTQQITAALLFLESYEQEKKDTTSLDRCRAILEEALAESRRLIRGLSPKKLDEEGIEAALEEFLKVPSPSSANVQLNIATELPPMAPWQRTTLFRFVQESITNARKHSEASNIKVSIRPDDSHLIVQIQDNGLGFDPDTVELTGYGLKSLRMKAEMLDGELKIESTPGQGTDVLLRLPQTTNERPSGN
ncbi:hypothetical protein GC197_12140 [bacterium]|nr:hypothetical protein [bacterium]